MTWADFEMITLRGLRKPSNDDRLTQKYEKGIHYFAVADGMNNGGHLASSLAVDSVNEYVMNEIFSEIENEETETSLDFYNRHFRNLVKTVNLKLVSEISKNGFWGIGTTLDLLFLDFRKEPFCTYAHFGDGRIYYKTSSDKLLRLTLDDAKHIEQNGEIWEHNDESRFNHSSGPNVYLGNLHLKRVKFRRHSINCFGCINRLEHNDIFLVCTDGLLDCVSENELETIFSDYELSNIVLKLHEKYLSPKEMVIPFSKAKNLSEEIAFKQLRGRDNASFYVIKIKEG